jgi:hypothetical protein
LVLILVHIIGLLHGVLYFDLKSQKDLLRSTIFGNETEIIFNQTFFNVVPCGNGAAETRYDLITFLIVSIDYTSKEI